MPTKNKSIDKRYVSTERSEIVLISKRFTSIKGGEYVPTSLLYSIQDVMRVNYGKVKRDFFYEVVKSLGYTDKK